MLISSVPDLWHHACHAASQPAVRSLSTTRVPASLASLVALAALFPVLWLVSEWTVGARLRGSGAVAWVPRGTPRRLDEDASYNGAQLASSR